MTAKDSELDLREFLGVNKIDGPLAIIEGASDVGYGEEGEVITADGTKQLCRVLEVSKDYAAVQLYGESQGLHPKSLRVRFQGHALKVPVAKEMLGRVFDGLGEPMDGLPNPIAEDRVFAQGNPLNPAARSYPDNHIITGISAIDIMDTLVRGQKLPIFSGQGLPHNLLAAQIASQAHVEGGEEFAIVFVALGVSPDVADQFEKTLIRSGKTNLVLFLNLSNRPALERIVTPHVALSLAEFLAFEHDMHVLVILSDMTNFCESIRELALRREEVPTRKGFPGHLYSDLAAIYERSGLVQGRKGSVTQMPVLTMPNDDITHPIPDLTGYVTEGQIVLDRSLHQKNIYPPIGVLKSLSRLMKDAIGKDKTRDDHQDLSDQLYSAYANVQRLRDLAEIVGEEELSETDRKYLKFGNDFENKFLSQEREEGRGMTDSFNIGWDILGNLPMEELTQVSSENLKKYYPGNKEKQE